MNTSGILVPRPSIVRTALRNADTVFATMLLSWVLLNTIMLILTPLCLAPDEAYYWEWSKRLDYSYFSKGPIIALLIRASTYFWGDTEFGVRFPALLLLTLFGIVLYWFLRRHYGSGPALVAWISLQMTPMFGSMGLIMTTDPPVALSWLLALISAYELVVGSEQLYPLVGKIHERAARESEAFGPGSSSRQWLWLPTFFFVGLGILSKYTAALIGVAILAFLFWTKRLRSNLSRSYFVLGLVACAICCAPIILWNAEHNWVNFAHNTGHLLGSSGFEFRPHGLIELFLGQLGLIGPVLLPVGAWVLVSGLRCWRTKGDLVSGLLLSVSSLLLVVCVVVSFQRRVYANWPMPAYIGLVILGVHLWHKGELTPRFLRTLRQGIGVNLCLLAIGYGLFAGLTFGLPGQILPTKRLVGWRELGAVVSREIEVVESRGIPIDFLVSSRYDIAAELAFYTGRPGEVFQNYHSKRRMSQYDIWKGWSRLLGKNALVVSLEDQPQPSIVEGFSALLPGGQGKPLMSFTYAGSPIHDRNFFSWVGLEYEGAEQPVPITR